MSRGEGEATLEATIAALGELQRVATALLDGDETRRVVTERAYFYATDPYPQHLYMAGDQFDVDLARHDRLKKFLLRLESLSAVRCNAGVWMLLPGREDLVMVVCHNGELHRWYRFGENARALVPEMIECRRTKARVAIAPTAEARVATVLGPILDSLGDVVGFVELTAPDPADPGARPAWS